MRKQDVLGPNGRFRSRFSAVYDCLADDLADAQIRIDKAAAARSVVTLIEFRDVASVLFDGVPLGDGLSSWLRDHAGDASGRSHGNYLPALDCALRILTKSSSRHSHLVLVFLSDGAPSDHGQRAAVSSACAAKVRQIGALLGMDRLFVGAVGFGPATEDYEVLKQIASAVPRGSFQKLGLSVNCLRTAFSSLASSIATMATDLAMQGGGETVSFSPRIGYIVAAGEPSEDRGGAIAEPVVYSVDDGSGREAWDIYCGPALWRKQVYSASKKRMVDEAFFRPSDEAAFVRAGWTQRGVAMSRRKLGSGAERNVFPFSNVLAAAAGTSAHRFGPRLVGKEALSRREQSNPEFHIRFCRMAAQAEQLAILFNNRLKGGPEAQVHFSQCAVFEVRLGGGVMSNTYRHAPDLASPILCLRCVTRGMRPAQPRSSWSRNWKEGGRNGEKNLQLVGNRAFPILF